jgi:alcohol dehydrogenase (NADP+)
MKPYVSLLKHDGALVSVGMLEATQAEAINFAEVAVKRVTIAGSFIGSIAETQEVLDFSAEHHVDPEIRIIDAESINDAFDDIADKRRRFSVCHRQLHVAHIRKLNIRTKYYAQH